MVQEHNCLVHFRLRDTRNTMTFGVVPSPYFVQGHFKLSRMKLSLLSLLDGPLLLFLARIQAFHVLHGLRDLQDARLFIVGLP